MELTDGICLVKYRYWERTGRTMECDDCIAFIGGKCVEGRRDENVREAV